MAEDFADGVEEVDLFVAAGQLVGEFAGLPLGIEDHAEEGGELGSEEGCARFGDARDFEPESSAARMGWSQTPPSLPVTRPVPWEDRPNRDRLR
jgi:hypothetical protein